jgi:hypothetical protein
MEKKPMKYRNHEAPLLPPEAYILFWKLAARSQPAPRKGLLRRLAAKLLVTAKLLLLAACSPSPEPSAIDPMSLVWVQPEGSKEPRAKTLPIVEGNPYEL